MVQQNCVPSHLIWYTLAANPTEAPRDSVAPLKTYFPIVSDVDMIAKSKISNVSKLLRVLHFVCSLGLFSHKLSLRACIHNKRSNGPKTGSFFETCSSSYSAFSIETQRRRGTLSSVRSTKSSRTWGRRTMQLASAFSSRNLQ